jgi:hypothetical protein
MNVTISSQHNYRRIVLAISLSLVAIALVWVFLPKAYGAQLGYRSLLLSDDRVNVSATYLLNFNITDPETLGSLKVQFCSNDPIINDVCIAPQGFDISSVTLGSESGVTDFTILASETDSNTLVLTRTPSTYNGGGVTLTFDNVINPADPGTDYARLLTYATSDASGSFNDYGGIAFGIVNPLQVTSTVPPYLLFCGGITISGFDCSTASGDYVNFGDINSTNTSSAQTQMVTATNANTGYNMYVYGTTLTSGNNVINPMATQDVSRPGISQFGINLVANQTPLVGANPVGPGVAAPTSSYDVPNWFKFVSNDVIASTSQPTNYTKLTASYIVNIPSNQSPGVYVTSLTYVCLANF